MFFGIEDVLNFPSLVGSVEYQKRQGICQDTRHFEWIYMGLKYPAIGILNEMFFTYKKTEFI